VDNLLPVAPRLRFEIPHGTGKSVGIQTPINLSVGAIDQDIGNSALPLTAIAHPANGSAGKFGS
jgi:hypothetical protein